MTPTRTAPDPTDSTLTLTLERTLDASPERVFDAWTNPDMLRRWFAPDEAMDTDAEVDLREGGRYRLVMGDHIVSGVYREVVPPTRLAFTWRWDEAESTAEMLVTVALAPNGSGTRLILVHERFPTAEARQNHAQGWGANLDRLATLLS